MYRVPVNEACRLCVRRNNLERKLIEARRARNTAMQAMISGCLDYVGSLHLECQRCGVLIGEHHLETTAYRRDGQCICRNCRDRMRQPGRRRRPEEQAQNAMIGMFEFWQQTAPRADRERVATAIRQDRKDWGRRTRAQNEG